MLSLQADPAGARGYLVDVWQSERGLPQNTVTGVAQTPDGYLWVSTLDGLARFDGASFTVFKAGNTPALGSGRIRFLLGGRHGDLWISTQEGGLIRLRNGQFTPLALPGPTGLRSPVIQVVEENSGELWISTEDGKVLRRAGGGFSTVSTHWEASAGKGAIQVKEDARHQLWAITETGLFRVEGGRLVSALQGEAGAFTVHCPSRAGGWWIAEKNALRLWRDGQWLAGMTNPVTADTAITCGLEDPSGQLWLGSASQGVFRCATNGTLLPFGRRDGLSSQAVRTLFEDAEGNLWIGTDGGGLNRVRAPRFTVYGSAQGLSSDRVTVVTEGPDGTLWVGTDGHGLNRLVGDAAQPLAREPAAASLRVSAVLADRAGRVWVGVRYEGVLRWEDGRFRSVGGSATQGRTTRCLFEDSHGTIWVGQYNTPHLVKIEGESIHTLALPPSMPPVDVRVMAEDARGDLWIGTDGSGLLRWRAGTFTRFTREQGLGSDFIWWLRPEADGTLWIGTYGGGLTRLKNERAVTCTTREGLVDDVICHIADDGRGQFWLSSNQGVFRVAHAQLDEFADGRRPRIQCVAYGKSDGLPTLECEGGSQSAGCRTRDGRLCFPTIRGLVVVDPAGATAHPAPPPVHIEALLVDGVPAQTRRGVVSAESETPVGKSPSEGTVGPAESLRVVPGRKRFEFRYTAVDFNAPEGLRFRHRLEGVDADWVETRGQRAASYDQLPHGTYTFRVQACNREGVWNERGASLPFTVLPCFWQTWWFLSLFLLTFGSTVGWAVGHVARRRHERHVRLLERLHAAERERTRIARDLHDDLGSSLTEIGLLGALAVRASTGEIREHVARIMDRAQALAHTLDQTVWAVNPNNDSFGHLTTYVCQFAREFFEPTRIRCRLDVAPDLPDLRLTTEVRHNLFLVAKEAMHNAVQHSAASEVWLRMALADGAFTLEIADDGHGFDVGLRRESGNGLRNMAARMEEIGGQLRIRSTPADGTTVCLRLPLPRREATARHGRTHATQLRDGTPANGD